MIKRKHSIAHITLVYLVIASLILAAMIMSFYTAVSIRAADSDSPALINSFVDTYKFMMNKEDETLSHLEKDSDVSEQLIASARRMSGEGFNEVVSGVMMLPEEQRPRIGFIPVGSTNDTKTSYDLPDNIAEAAQTALNGVPFRTDIGATSSGSYFA